MDEHTLLTVMTVFVIVAAVALLIQAAMLAIYAERDRANTQAMLPVANAMLAKQKVVGVSIYEGVGHAFHNDTGAAYDATAAQDAWARTIAHFNKVLRRPVV